MSISHYDPSKENEVSKPKKKLQKFVYFYIVSGLYSCLNKLILNSKSKFNLIMINGDRIRKQCRYSALITLTLRMIKQIDVKLYRSEVKITEKQKIKRQKNYYIIVFRICRAYSHLLKKFNYTQESIINYIYEYLENQLDRQIQSKYNDHELVEQTKKKNHRDLKIIMATFQCDLNNFSTIQNHLSHLYEIKAVRQHQKQLKVMTKIFMKFSNATANEDQWQEKNISKSMEEKISEDANLIKKSVEKQLYQINHQMLDILLDKQSELNEYKDSFNTRNIYEQDDFLFVENFIREKSGSRFLQFDYQIPSGYPFQK